MEIDPVAVVDEANKVGAKLPQDAIGSEGHASDVGRWRCVSDFDLSTSIRMRKYVHADTGLTVCIGNVEEACTNGFFALTTEAAGDEGCPHTLEHLVFLGSKKYPYKGVLDSLANRTLAQGTNAWTDTDETVYTLTTAGSEGFLALLPVFLDHILFPTLTPEGCYTEVHHVNGDGDDAGVVYCEMQARENTSWSIADLSLKRALFAGSGYALETGGMLEPLRDLSVETIQQYHRDYYRADNLCCVVTGKVDPADVFVALEPVVESIMAAPTPPPREKPFTTPLPPFTESVTKEEEFPDDDEETGVVVFGWRGPVHSEFVAITALDVLWEYLTDTPIAPLQKALVETVDPLCSDVSVHSSDRVVKSVEVWLDGVPVDKLSDAPENFFAVLRAVAAEGLDMGRLHAVLTRFRLRYLDRLQSQASDVCCDVFTNHFHYGTDDSELAIQADVLVGLDDLATRSPSFWADLLKEYIVECPVATVIARPSAELGEAMREDEKARVAARKKQLGDAGLAELGSKLEAANEANNREVPDEVIAAFPIPSPDSVSFPVVHTVAGGENKSGTETGATVLARVEAEAAFNRLPYAFQFDHFGSAFFEVVLLFDSAGLSPLQRTYLQLVVDTVFEMPLRQDGTGPLLSHEAVVQGLAEDTVSQSCSLGPWNRGSFKPSSHGQVVTVKIRGEAAKYTALVGWLRDCLFNANLEAERIQIAASKLLVEIPDIKRSGFSIASAGIRDIIYSKEDSNVGAVNFMRQADFLEGVVEALGDGTSAEARAVVDAFAATRAALFSGPPKVQVAGDVLATHELAAPWESFYEAAVAAGAATTGTTQSAGGGGGGEGAVTELTSSASVLSELGKEPNGVAVAFPLGAVESSFLFTCTRGPAGYDDPSVVVLGVLLEYLTRMEGLFWKQLRGLGYSYGYHSWVNEDEGMLYFRLTKSTQVAKAYEAARDIVRDLASGALPFNALDLDAAKSGYIFSVVEGENTADDSAWNAFLNLNVRRVTLNYNATLLAAVKDVTLAELKAATEKYLVPLFDPAATATCVVMNSGKGDEVTAELAALGLNVNSSDLSVFFTGKEAVGDDDADSTAVTATADGGAAAGGSS